MRPTLALGPGAGQGDRLAASQHSLGASAQQWDIVKAGDGGGDYSDMSGQGQQHRTQQQRPGTADGLPSVYHGDKSSMPRAVAASQVRQNGLFEPCMHKNDHFAQTGSGQTKGKLKKRTVFPQSAPDFPGAMLDGQGSNHAAAPWPAASSTFDQHARGGGEGGGLPLSSGGRPRTAGAVQ